MTFNKKTWATGDVITADLLNAIEQAVSDHDTNITSVLNNMGDPTQLSTTNKSLVAAINEVKGIIPQGGMGGSGVLVYNTLTDLQNAYPSGTNQPVWIIADNAWYYWSGSITVPTVTVSPASGTYNATQTITLTANETATIYYTTDGSTPTTSSSVYSNPISVSATTTIMYFAKDTSGNLSSVQSATFTIDTTPPIITSSSSGGTFASAQTVTLSSNETATIYYTLDGSIPTTSSLVYSSALNISSTSTLKFFGKDTAGNSSTVQSITFTITAPDTTPPTVTISPVAGIYNSTQSVTLSANETATIYYTLDGSTPTTSSTVYSNPISVSSTETVKYFAVDTSGNSSSVQSATYTIDTTPPVITISPAAGTYNSTQSVTLSSNETATIYYTTDGSTPTTSSSVYSNPINVSSTETIKYFAKDTAGNSSTVQSATYTINIPDTTPPVVTASPAAGTYTSAQSVQLTGTDNSGGAVTIYYTTDGTTPTTSSTVYSTPIAINATTTLQFIGQDASGNISTPVAATYTINIPVAAGNAVLMNGTSDYISVPSINFDTVEITLDLLNSTTTQELFYGDTQNYATINTIGNNLSQRYVNGTSVSSLTSPPLNLNQKYTLKFTLKAAVTEAIVLFAGAGGSSNWLNAIFYGATFYLAGNIVAKYDTSSGGLTDQSGNGKDATLHGGTWKTNPMYINTSASPAAVTGSTWGIKNVPTFTLTTNITNHTIYYEWSTSSNDTNLTTSSSVYSAPLPWPLQTGGTRYLRYFGVNNDTGDQTSITTVTVQVDDTAPANVTALTATPAQTTVALSWTAPTTSDLASYNVYNGATLVANVLKGTNSYTVTGLTASTSYTFKVTSVDTVGNESAGTTVTTTTTA